MSFHRAYLIAALLMVAAIAVAVVVLKAAPRDVSDPRAASHEPCAEAA